MSDPKPDRILAEESDNPWVKLILWAHEDSVRGTERWNGFIKYLVEERLDTDSAAFAVDTHIHRLAQRWGLTNGKNVKKTEADLKKLFNKSIWNKLHLQIIFWGREFCQAKACYGLECNICNSCYPKRIKPFAHKKP